MILSSSRSASAAGSSEPAIAPDPTTRSVAGHRFTAPQDYANFALDSAIAASYLGAATELGWSTLRSANKGVAGLGAALNGGIRLLRVPVASSTLDIGLDAHAGISIQVGTSLDSLFVARNGYRFHEGFGATLSQGIGHVRLGLHFAADWFGGQDFDTEGFVDDLSKNGAATFDSYQSALVVPAYGNMVGGSLNLAAWLGGPWDLQISSRLERRSETIRRWDPIMWLRADYVAAGFAGILGLEAAGTFSSFRVAGRAGAASLPAEPTFDSQRRFTFLVGPEIAAVFHVPLSVGLGIAYVLDKNHSGVAPDNGLLVGLNAVYDF